jgi:NAD(P)-dependent dehydrogenase (short-subunit alcohol dehydrogenase family)
LQYSTVEFYSMPSIPQSISRLVNSAKEFAENQWNPLPYPEADFTGMTVIVTGANVGLGFHAACHFVRLGAAKVILACRSREKGNQAKADIEASCPTRNGVVEAWQLDLSSFNSVKSFCIRALQMQRLDIVVENAAVMRPDFVAAEGYESTITVNVISTFLMALLLLPIMRKTSQQFGVQPHLVIVSSVAHSFVCPFLSPPPPTTSPLVGLAFSTEEVTGRRLTGYHPILGSLSRNVGAKNFRLL